MFRFYRTLQLSLISVFILSSFASCGGSKEETEAEGTQQVSASATVTSKAPSDLPNYRYVDIDTILNKYNLAKDYLEEMTRMQENMQSQMKRQENAIQNLANQIQTKYQNNGYLTEASFASDQEKLGKMQMEYQDAAQKLQAQLETALITSNKTVSDSIDAFIKLYNVKKGYDAIFYKSATGYINPALDITSEIVEGLNARYNKVK